MMTRIRPPQAPRSRPLPRPFWAALLLTALAACADVPQLEGTLDATDRNAPFPDLVPASQLLAPAPGSSGQRATTPYLTATSDDVLEARAAQLRRKAQALRARTFED